LESILGMLEAVGGRKRRLATTPLCRMSVTV
jgi:hypothetical protein